jgi:hypothetical protein
MERDLDGVRESALLGWEFNSISWGWIFLSAVCKYGVIIRETVTVQGR